MRGRNLCLYGDARKIIQKLSFVTLSFLTYETEFVLFSAVLENAVLPMG